MPRQKNASRGVADVTNAVRVLNDRAPGAGDQLSQVIRHLSGRIDAQAGHRGTVAITKQPTTITGGTAAGLNLNGTRLTGMPDPVQGKDLVTLDFFRRHETCDAFRQRVEDCLKLEQPVEVNLGPSEWTISNITALDLYVYQSSEFILLFGVTVFVPGGPPHQYNFAVIETPPLVQSPPIVIRSTYTPVRPGLRFTALLPNEAEGVAYGPSDEDRGDPGHHRIATLFNTLSISNVDAIGLVASETVLFQDGPPGADGVTIGSIVGAGSYHDGKAIVFQSGSGSIITGSSARIRFFVKYLSGGSQVFILDDVLGSPPEGSIIGVSIGEGDMAYVFQDVGDDPGRPSYYILRSIYIGGHSAVLMNSQIIDTGVPHGGSPQFIQAAGDKLHVLSAKYDQPFPSPRFQVWWKIYDISTPGVPVLKHNMADPCNRWQAIHEENDCVMLTERGFNMNATLWDASDPTDPQLIGGCKQTETPVVNFLRDSRGYTLDGIGGRLHIHDFIGHGVACP